MGHSLGLVARLLSDVLQESPELDGVVFGLINLMKRKRGNTPRAWGDPVGHLAPPRHAIGVCL